MVVLLRPVVSLGWRHLEHSQLSTSAGSIQLYSRTSWFRSLLAAGVVHSADFLAMATLFCTLAGSNVGSV